MITITVGNVMGWRQNNNSPKGLGRYSVYLFRDGGLVLYVGKTRKHVLDRMGEHLGFTHSISQIGQLVLDNLPPSLDWQIDLFQYDERIDLIHKHVNPHVVQPTPELKGIFTDLLEEALIVEYRPSINCTFNDNPAPLPERYTARSRERQEEIKGIVLSHTGDDLL